LTLELYRSTTLPCLSTRNLVKFHSAGRDKEGEGRAGSNDTVVVSRLRWRRGEHTY
jgi:hypothetical protein